MSYDSEVLADAPLIYLKLDDGSGTTNATDLGSLGSGVSTWPYSAATIFQQPPVTADGGFSVGNTGVGPVPVLQGAGTLPITVGPEVSAEFWYNTGSVATIALPFTLIFEDVGATVLNVMELIQTGATVGPPGFDLALAYGGGSATSGPYAGVANQDWHVVVTVDAAGTYILYLNGVQVDTQPLGTPSGDWEFSAGSGAGVGAIMGYPGFYAPDPSARGDNFAIYGTALSSARVAAHYAAGTVPAAMLTARGSTAVTVTGAATSTLRSDGATSVHVFGHSYLRAPTTHRAVAGVVVTVTTPAIVNGHPTVPAYWAQLPSTVTVLEGAKHIHAIADPNPVWNPATSGWTHLPKTHWAARWSVNDLPDPSAYSAGYYWLGDPSGYDGTSNIQSGARQWNAEASTSAPPWRSHYPFKPSVTVVNHYLQGGGIVHHPKGVNFNSHFIEHMWTDLLADRQQPFSWVIAGTIASWPTPKYVHTILDSGVSPASKGIDLSAADCNTPRYINETDSFRTRMAVARDELYIGAGYGTASTMRANVPTPSTPCMFFGIYAGANSYCGVYRPGSTVSRKGHIGSTGAKNLILGRAQGWLAQSKASHLLLFELRFFSVALSTTQLEDQYDQLSSTHQFDAYRTG
jgi:hypothetical protein